MTKFLSTLLVTATILTTAMPAPKAMAVEASVVTAVGVLGTLVIYGAGYGVYGTGYFTLALAGKSYKYKMENYRPALDVVASGDESLITPDIRAFLTQVRIDQPVLNDISDLAILGKVVDSITNAL